MPLYEYENGAGERRKIYASMKAPPPAVVIFFGRPGDHPYLYREPTDQELEGVDGRDITTAPAKLFFRVLAMPGVSVPQHGLTYKKSPASRALPRRKVREGKLDRLDGHDVIRHKDGGYTTLDGRPIVQNKADVQRECKRTGMDFD